MFDLYTGEVACVAINVAKVGFEDAVRAEHERLIEPVSREAGYLQYDLHYDLDDPRRFVIVERWASRADFDAHCIAPHIEAFLEATRDMIEFATFHPLAKIT